MKKRILKCILSIVIGTIISFGTTNYGYAAQAITYSEDSIFENREDATQYLNIEFLNRSDRIVITLSESLYKNEDFFDILYDAPAYYETSGVSYSNTYVDGGIQFIIQPSYRITAEENAKLMARIDDILEELSLDGKTEYQKIRLIHDYICANVNYDYTYTKYSAYDAVFTGEAVCQGYANLFYRMCYEAGLSVNTISGIGNGGGHAWNIVKIGDVYYNMDTTWDGQSDETRYSYFLKNEKDFVNHARDDRYITDKFYSDYPMANDSWMDYSKVKNSMSIENIANVTFDTIDDTTISNQAENGRAKLLVFGSASCGYTQNTLSNIAFAEFGDIDVVFIESNYGTLDTVKNLKETYGSGSDDITYVYSTGYTALNTLWDYVDSVGLGDLRTFPLLVYIDGNNVIQYVESSEIFNAGYVRNIVDTYLKGNELAELSKNTISLNKGDSTQLSISVYGTKRNAQFFTWTSSDSSVVSVDENGVIKALKTGTATITCKINDQINRTCTVTVTGEMLDTPVISSINVNATGVTVTWGKISGAEKYCVFRKTSTGWKKIGETTGTTYTDQTAIVGSSYTYTIRCVSGDGKTYTSSYDTKGKTISYISAPKITQLQTNATGVAITWGKISGAEKYYVYRKTSTSWKKIGETTGTTYTDQTTIVGSSYTYTIRCVSEDGKSYTSYYDTKGKTISYLSAPKITQLQATATGVTITWEKISGAEKYYVYRKTSTSWKKVGETTGTMYIDQTVTTGANYTYTIRCVSGDGESYTSYYDTKGKTITYLSAPKITKIEATATGLTVTWGKVSGAEKYYVYRKTSTSWKKVGETTGTTYTDQTAIAGANYTYTVRCVSGDGKSYTSYYDTKGKTIAYLSIPEITQLQATATGVTITWGKVSGAEKYYVFKKTNTGWKKIGETTGMTYTDQTVVAGSSYTYTVRCVTSDGKTYTSYYDTKGKTIEY